MSNNVYQLNSEQTYAYYVLINGIFGSSVGAVPHLVQENANQVVPITNTIYSSLKTCTDAFKYIETIFSFFYTGGSFIDLIISAWTINLTGLIGDWGATLHVYASYNLCFLQINNNWRNVMYLAMNGIRLVETNQESIALLTNLPEIKDLDNASLKDHIMQYKIAMQS